MTIAPTFSGARQSRVERDSHTQELCEHNKHDFFLYLQTSSKIGLSTFVWALGALTTGAGTEGIRTASTVSRSRTLVSMQRAEVLNSSSAELSE